LFLIYCRTAALFFLFYVSLLKAEIRPQGTSWRLQRWRLPRKLLADRIWRADSNSNLGCWLMAVVRGRKSQNGIVLSRVLYGSRSTKRSPEGNKKNIAVADILGLRYLSLFAKLSTPLGLGKWARN
jgi:hypothetical protein